MTRKSFHDADLFWWKFGPLGFQFLPSAAPAYSCFSTLWCPDVIPFAHFNALIIHGRYILYLLLLTDRTDLLGTIMNFNLQSPSIGRPNDWSLCQNLRVLVENCPFDSFFPGRANLMWPYRPATYIKQPTLWPKDREGHNKKCISPNGVPTVP